MIFKEDQLSLRNKKRDQKMMLWLSDFNACASSFKWHSAITEIRKENHESLIMKIVNHASHCYVQSRITQLFWTQSRITLIIWDPFILGDPGTVSQVGRKGGTKVFKYGWKSPWAPTLTELFPKILADAGSWLGTKSVCIIEPIGEQFLLSSPLQHQISSCNINVL